MLSDLAARLQEALGLRYKQDIQTAAVHLRSSDIPVGDDCAAIPDGDGYLLLAAEGLLPQFIETDPWFAGWCAVMVNVSDIAAMGGRATAIVDTIWSQTEAATQPIWEGLLAASKAYGVPIVGGHTNCHSAYTALSASILGRATRLMTSFDAQPDDVLLVAADFRGEPHPTYSFWNAATQADPARLRADLELLPQLAEAGLCNVGKDISMGGILGTLLMLLETSGCGAEVVLEQVPCPETLTLEKWLVSFPSYGFLLSVRPSHVEKVQSYFHQRDLVCEAIGMIQVKSQVVLKYQSETTIFWDFAQQTLTGFAPSRSTIISWAEGDSVRYPT